MMVNQVLKVAQSMVDSDDVTVVAVVAVIEVVRRVVVEVGIRADTRVVAVAG